MANERIVRFSVDVEADSTHFRIFYSPDAGGTITGFDPVNASPADAADIAVGLLDDGVYVIDGINVPAGNEAAASRKGNFYSLQLKNLGGYGNPGPWFEIGGTYTSPTVQEILDYTGIDTAIEEISSNALAALISSLLPAAELKTRLAVGGANFNATDLETDEISALQMAVICRVGAAVCRRVANKKGFGTQSPRVMEEAESLRAQADVWDKAEGSSSEETPGIYGEAQEWDRGFLAAIGEDPPLEEAAAELEFGTIIDVNGEFLDTHFPQWLGETEYVIH